MQQMLKYDVEKITDAFEKRNNRDLQFLSFTRSFVSI